MKKISSFILTAGALIVVASCAKELNVAETAPENIKEVNITVIASEKPEVEAETKTFIDGTSVKWSNSGEKLKVFEVATPSEGDAVTSQTTSAEGVTTDSGATMSFGVTVEDKSGDNYASFDYYAFYPSSAYQSYTSVNAVAINTKGAQTPSATNFDASQDLLIAKKIENGTDQASTLEMQFARVVAIGKMTIKNLETTDPITKITFSAKVGEEAVALAGRTTFNLETAKPASTYASNTQDHAIILDYEGQNITANTSEGMVAYFTCYPFAINATTPGSFKVVVETATQSFTKEVNVSSPKGLAFNIGKASVFSVNMDGIAGETKAADLRYAYLDYNDFVNNGGSTSYGNVTVNKTHGDSWTMFAIGTNNAIGVRNNGGDNPQNDSYIKLPDFNENIKTVVVTLKNVTASKTITLESTATAYNGSIASLTTSEATVYTFDLSSASVKTAYFRSRGAQAQVVKIEVYAGTDNRTAFDAPATVTAALNTDDANVTNSIDVTWSSVDGASGYVITLTPDSGDDVVVKAASSPYTVTDLAYEMDYLVSVQAEPADYYVNTISAETTASDVVTTGAAPSGVVILTEFEITPGDNTVKGTNNGKLAYRLGTGSNNGSLTFDAGYESITFTLAGWASGTRAFTITNGKINSSASLNPAAGTPTGNINAGFNESFSGTEYTIIVDDPTQEVVFSGRRAVVWNFTAVESAPDTRTDVTLSFAEDEYEFVVNSDDYNAFTPQVATADPNDAAITSAISYALTDPSGVVTGFNTSTGAFTLTGNTGTATITASYAGDENYKPAADVSYTVKVNPVPGSEVTFAIGTDITNLTDLNGGVTKDGITLSATTSAWYNPLRFYANDEMTISSTTATITKVTFNYSRTGDQGKIKQNNSNLTTSGQQVEYWTGSSSSVTFVNKGSAQARISSVVVEYD